MAINGKDKDLDAFIQSVQREQNTGISRYYYDDPTTMGFNIMFDFEGANSPLFNESGSGESAIRYLENIDEREKAESLRQFKKRLQDLVKNYPYYFQTLSGMGNIYDIRPTEAYVSDRLLTIGTLESIDMRISSLVENYIDASWDMTFRREMLPINLRRFKCYVILSEVRGIKSFINGALTDANGNPLQNDDNKMKQINDLLSVFVYVFDDCEFEFGESNTWMESMTNSSPEEASNQIKIKTRQMSISNKLGFLELFLKGNLKDSSMTAFKSTLGKPNGGDKKKTIMGTLGDKVSGYKDLTLDLMRREADDYLGVNDPKNIASRIAQDAIFSRIDRGIKTTLFNVFGPVNALGLDDVNKFISDKILKNTDSRPPVKANVFDVAKIDLEDNNRNDLGDVELNAKFDGDRLTLGRNVVGKKVPEAFPNLGTENLNNKVPGTKPDLGDDTLNPPFSGKVQGLGAFGVGNPVQSTRNNMGVDNLNNPIDNHRNDLGDVPDNNKSNGTKSSLSGVKTGDKVKSTKNDLGGVPDNAHINEEPPTLGIIDLGQRSEMNKVFFENVLGFDKFPFSSVIRAFVKANLGNVINKGNNIS